MSWAYLDKPEMTQQLAEAYTRIGNENDALVIPAGLAFAKSVAERPDIALYTADNRHPTMEGTYLAALTTYAAIFKQNPVGGCSGRNQKIVAPCRSEKARWLIKSPGLSFSGETLIHPAGTYGRSFAGLRRSA